MLTLNDGVSYANAIMFMLYATKTLCSHLTLLFTQSTQMPLLAVHDVMQLKLNMFGNCPEYIWWFNHYINHCLQRVAGFFYPIPQSSRAIKYT